MIPAGFAYTRAASAAEALSLLAEHGDEAKLLAGGHSLLPLMKLRLAQPERLIDIGEVADLSYINDGGDHVAVGALTRHRDVEHSDLLAKHLPLLAHVAAHVGDPQVRNRGTIGGSLVHGDPASDLPSVALTTGATMVITGPSGERTVAAADFFQGFLETAVGADELLTEIRFPKHTGAGWGFQKFNRRAQDWAIVGCSVQAAADGNGGGVALVNMGSTPMLASSATDALRSGSSAADIGSVAAEGTEPPSDLHAQAAYRQHLARVLVERAATAAGL
ncbi:MAG: xanthine dehydrogenase family protein subunit M [Acidimicrobiia bacterium]|nr:xanthine dehydrogenase family protein subunit M [Acidimicrobiia bacterium]